MRDCVLDLQCFCIIDEVGTKETKKTLVSLRESCRIIMLTDFGHKLKYAIVVG